MLKCHFHLALYWRFVGCIYPLYPFSSLFPPLSLALSHELLLVVSWITRSVLPFLCEFKFIAVCVITNVITQVPLHESKYSQGFEAPDVEIMVCLLWQ